MKHKQYIHDSTGNPYYLVDTILFKYNGKWVDAIIYRNPQGQVFGRTLEDFNEKFSEISIDK